MGIKRVSIVLLVAALALVGVVSAQDTSTAFGEYSGVLEDYTDGVLTVSGLTFQAENVRVDDGVDWRPGGLAEISFSASGGVLTAVSVDSQEEDNDLAQGSIEGAIEAVSAGSLVMGGLTFDISGADIDDDAVLEVGEGVEVRFTVDGGALVAFRVDDLDDTDTDTDTDTDEDTDEDTDNDDLDDDDNCLIPFGWYEYEVRRGDTLSGIATAAGISLAELVTANCLDNPSLIRVDDDLYLPIRIGSGGGDDDDDDRDEDRNDDDDRDDDNGNDDDRDDDNGTDDDRDDDNDDDDDRDDDNDDNDDDRDDDDRDDD